MLRCNCPEKTIVLFDCGAQQSVNELLSSFFRSPRHIAGGIVCCRCVFMGQVERVAILRRRNSLIMLESFHKVFIVAEADLKGNLLDRFGGMVQERFGVQNLVARLHVAPAFILAKGGITSSDIGVKALNVRRADVMGQISPGVPVWQTGAESKFPRLPYIIFPGNVGQTTTLRDIVQSLTQSAACLSL